MATLIDFNQNVIAATCAIAKPQNGIEITVDVIRHIVLDSIRQFRQRFKDEYGELIICVDSKSWRKGVFPYYKAARKLEKEGDTFLPWDVVFEAINTIAEELDEFFPYPVVRVDGAEADDIIGVLCKHYGENTMEKVMIVSSDKDFHQLQVYPGVDQYSPLLKKRLVENTPEKYLKEHIIRGDKGDGIPNVKSPDDVFVMGGRQGMITQKFLDECMETPIDDWEDENLKRNFLRNQAMVDLVNGVPEDLEKKILECWDGAYIADRRLLLGYMSKRRLKILMDRIGEF